MTYLASNPAQRVLESSAFDDLVHDPGPVPKRIESYLRFKYRFEQFLGCCLLVLFAPLILVLMLLVKLTSRGPAIYSQRRTGEHGRSFTLYKLRSMVVDAEAKSGIIWSRPGDPRVTWLGRILRFTHLDELTQLINVVRGEMCLVGPRPERPELVNVLTNRVDRYFRRHAIKPGISGLAQIYLPPDEDLESVRKKTRFDLFYLHYTGLAMDLRILVCTALRLLGIRHGIGPRWTGLNRQVARIQLKRNAVSAKLRTQALPIASNLQMARPIPTARRVSPVLLADSVPSDSFKDHVLESELQASCSHSDSSIGYLSDILDFPESKNRHPK